MQSQFRYHDAGAPMTVSRQAFRRIEAIDECPDFSWRDEADRERLEALRDGSWHLMGVQASATVLVPHGQHMIAQTITSPGHWGVESDSGDDYLDGVFAAECDTLAGMLRKLGVTVTA